METQLIEHTERSHSRTGSHVSHEQEMRNLRLEINHLCKKLRRRECDRRNSTLPLSEVSEEKRDQSYQWKSMTPPSESFSVSSHSDKLEKHRKKRGEISSPRNMWNDAMSKALHQI